ncbi:ABC transporter ATP-binding protein [Clostridium massiliamazoniense]|uniref:ABC transporter ATP-binding protein n=1 Tax=Clostridium massiliamazoniense TaxID=1347366 RepID=UPI0006D7BBD8|nr:ABC transporter ATP-binding protein [Clostridium massiliamazoniense]
MSILLNVKNLVVNLKVSNGEVKAIRNISFTVNKGETLAIVGESGCGKSILCKSLIGILPKNGYIKEGSILFNKEDLSKFSQREFEKIRGKKIAMVFQDPMTVLNPTFSVGKQIMETILLHERLDKKSAKKRTIELMEMVGIDNAKNRFNQYPQQFSGGMRQRIVIAIALACKPELLIADEPTTALDVTVQAQILELLKKLQKTLNLSIIFVTHDLGVVANIAHRVAVIYAGKLVEIGKVEEIFFDYEHPYTEALINSLPNLDNKNEYLPSIEGIPPSLINPPKGDAFAERNKRALVIDYLEEPPMFDISESHSSATWLLHPKAYKTKMILNLEKDKKVNHG